MGILKAISECDVGLDDLIVSMPVFSCEIFAPTYELDAPVSYQLLGFPTVSCVTYYCHERRNLI